MRRLHGFTLIELLVVIPIIAIPAPILFPVSARARAKSCEASCLSTLKQIALGMMMYTQDYDGYYPLNRYPAYIGFTGNANNVYWQYAIDPYMNAAMTRTGNLYGHNLNVWKCPAARLQSESLGGSDTWYGGAYSHYGMNVRLGRYLSTSAPQLCKDSEIKYPSQTMLVGESQSWNSTRQEMWGHYMVWGYINRSEYTRYDHDGRANISFCDGHAKNGTEGQWTDGTWKMLPSGSS